MPLDYIARINHPSADNTSKWSVLITWDMTSAVLTTAVEQQRTLGAAEFAPDYGDKHDT